MKSIILMASVVLFSTVTSQAQIKNAKTETVKVYGNCEMCESTIEKANDKKTAKVDWNKDTKLATITYDSKKTDVDAVLKNIALAGYDNEKYLAPDEAYNKLDGCCQYDREKKAKVITKDTATTMPSHADHNPAKTEKVKEEVNKLKAVFDNYFAMKDAMVKSDAAAASAKATALLTALNAVKMESLKNKEHDVWMEVEKKLKADAQSISSKKDIAAQRDIFMRLSQNMYDLVKASKPSETVYYQNCPMYNDGKGANWFSKESVVKNPYYGSSMLSCGKTVETIK